MDRRRRFVPSADRLEDRQMLSTTAQPLTAAALQQRAQALINQQQSSLTPLRALKIENLPRSLAANAPDRIVPPDVISALQDDLRAITGTLHRASPLANGVFNGVMRSTITHASLHVEDAASMNAAFAKVLDTAGVDPNLLTKFRGDMNDLARVDSIARDPAIVAANDYAFITQMCLGLGIPTPQASVQAIQAKLNAAKAGKT